MFLLYDLFGLLIFPEREGAFVPFCDHSFTHAFIEKLLNIYLWQALYSTLGFIKDGRDMPKIKGEQWQRG